MNRRIVVSTLLLLITSLALPAAAEPLLVSLKEGRMRSGPATEYQVLWILPKGYPVEGLAKYREWWAVRKASGHVGWMHELSVEKGRGALVTNEKANVRNVPSTDGRLVFSVPKGYLFRILEERDNWYKVKDAEGDEGWIYAPLIWINK
jgi:SH3-like domain-containing protein